jgi:hypothetical protein
MSNWSEGPLAGPGPETRGAGPETARVVTVIAARDLAGAADPLPPEDRPAGRAA